MKIALFSSLTENITNFSSTFTILVPFLNQQRFQIFSSRWNVIEQRLLCSYKWNTCWIILDRYLMITIRWLTWYKYRFKILAEFWERYFSFMRNNHFTFSYYCQNYKHISVKISDKITFGKIYERKSEFIFKGDTLYFWLSNWIATLSHRKSVYSNVIYNLLKFGV